MSRLYDDLLIKGSTPDFLTATVIVVDNVIDYCYDNASGKLVDSGFPGIKLPFDNCFLDGRYLLRHGGELRRFGVHIRVTKDQSVDYQLVTGIGFGSGHGRMPKKPKLLCYFTALLNDDGFTYVKIARGNDQDIPDSELELFYGLLHPFWTAIEFMNCKNVELVDNPPPPKLSRRHEKEHGQPLVTFKTIKVNSMRTAKHYTDLNAQGNPKLAGDSHMPLHINRGHFKDYRDGKGLFGKFKGVYWWDQHVRGSIENGAVIKDYDVLAPKNPNPTHT